MHIIGTAGHVDHGKSALVQALTGTNPDRWEEERARGMTLDLGFAHLRFDDGTEAGIVDVPGHERFLHNMLAGASGMELLLLVVDAVEGVREQTLEHLAILQLLGVQRVIVVASKIDRVAPAERDTALRSIEAALRNTIAGGAPIYAVSSVTGENLEQLREALHAALLQMPARNAAAPVYLPIDRVFSLPGLGTILTGTLMQGCIAQGDRLRIEPGDTAAHVRSVGVFGAVPRRAEAGTRVALNVAGVDRHAVRRGEAVVGPEFTAARDFTVRFHALQAAMPLIRRRTPVRAYVGSAEILGTLVCDDLPDGHGDVSARLHLREPVVAFNGVRFVLRRPSPMTLLGGGVIEGHHAATFSEQETSDEATVRSIIRERGLQSIDVHEIAAAANLRETQVFAALNTLADRGDIVRIARPRAYVDGIAASELFAKAVAHLEAAQEAEPWAMGMTSIALSRALRMDEPLIVRVLEHFVESGRLAKRGGYYATTDYTPSLTGEQRSFFDSLVPIDDANPFVPIPFAGVASAAKLSGVKGVRRSFDTMLERGMLVKVGDDLYRGAQIARIVNRVETHLRERGQMTAAEFRDLLGTSRKYAVPLLEWLDAHGVTIRSGDLRTLRKKESA
jgi:selenocysteine-specific elongation factor